ncbi:MAG: carbohydrate-binding protein [Fibrobacter sp.]|nr:carbohydrate-binding protein [Fibrobacter sp.]
MVTKTIKSSLILAAAFGLASTALADNPISTYHYLADPGAAADDEYFYIITDSDDPAPYNSDGYKIYALYGFRSKDMQNWTDFGIIYDARKVNGINDIWASGIATDPKTGKLYIVFPDGGGGGIGYIKADSIAGPWSNAVGQGKDKLVGGRGIIGCDGVSWCFDPAIFIDDDGTSYVTWGGGESNSRPNTDNFDIVKLNDAKDAPVGNGSHVKVNNLPTRKMLEASYIHKYKGNYYFSYSTGWQQGAPTIDYGMSNSVTGPYTWKGTILGDPSMNGKSINGNNNHHGIAGFKDHWYVVYHDRRIAKGHNGLEIIPADDGKANPNEGYHRSVSVDEMFYNADGTIQTVKCTNEGPEQIENFDPYDWYPALTSSKQKGIRSRSNFVQGKVAEHYLLPLSTKESWIRVSGVDFGTAATGFVVEAASAADGNKIEIRTGSATGTLAGTCELKNTGSKTTFAENNCEVEGLKGIVNYLFLVFKGSQDSTMSIKAWGFEGSGTTPPTPQSPFGGKAWAIPGTIQMEDFDEPGVGRGSDIKSYNENDSENHSCTDEGKEAECSKYRDGTGVDIYDKGNGKLIVGYINEGEWLEYTVNVAKDGDYTMFAAVASDGGSSFKLSMDDVDITENVAVPAANKADGDEQNFNDYSKVKANVSLKAGEHILRFTATADWMDIDYINFVEGKDATDDKPVGSTDVTQPSVGGDDSIPQAIGAAANIRLNVAASKEYKVFDLQGHMVGSVNLSSMSASEAIKAAGFSKGIYMLKQVNGAKKFMVNAAK